METTQQYIAKIQNGRGKVSTNFASLEYFIAQFITLHYFNGPNHDFTAEVFEDEYFSFGLLVKIFDKVLKKDPDLYKKFPFQKLRRLQKLRNVIVHARLQSKATLDDRKENIKKIGITLFYHAGKEYKVEEVFEEYEKLRNIVQPAIMDLPGMNSGVERVLLRS